MYNLEIFLTPVLRLKNGNFEEICEAFNGDYAENETKYDGVSFETIKELNSYLKIFKNVNFFNDTFTAKNLPMKKCPELLNPVDDYDLLVETAKEHEESEKDLLKKVFYQVEGVLKDEDGNPINYNDIVDIVSGV